MPPHAHLGAEPIKDLANYVRSLSGLTADSVRVGRGREVFNSVGCSGCHGADGKGMLALGAPNLTDKVWLYGSAEAVIVETITKGRNNQMPAWKDFLGEAKIHLLSAYVLSLSATAEKQ
jgi:cytochrome c oxidase cbb3-type subunit 3